MHTRNRLCLAALALVFATVSAAEPPPATPPSRFAETLTVRELEVRFDASGLPNLRSIGRKAKVDFTVLEGGVAREITRFDDELPADEGWSLLLWLDPALASRDALAASTDALAELADRLVATGPVELVAVAEGHARTRISTRSPASLRAELARFGADARRRADSKPPLADRLHALDLLATEAAVRGAGAAHAVLAVVDDWSLGADAMSDLARLARGGPSADNPLHSLDEDARILAAYGWVFVPVAVGSQGLASPAPRTIPAPTLPGPTGDVRHSVPLVTIGGTGEAAASEEELATATDLGLAPLAHVARVTSGTVVADRDAIDRTLSRLRDRHRLVYRSPDPQPGALLSLSILWKGGDGRPLPAPRWIRASLPRELTAAHLRGLLGGGAAIRSLALDLARGDGGPTMIWKLPRDFVKTPSAPVRFSWAALHADGSIEEHVGAVAPASDAGGLGVPGDRLAVPTGAIRIAAIAENLESESWWGSAIDLPRPRDSH